MKEKVHASHKMIERVEVRAPSATPRYYTVHQCENCGHEWMEHPAGRFFDASLTKKCDGA